MLWFDNSFSNNIRNNDNSENDNKSTSKESTMTSVLLAILSDPSSNLGSAENWSSWKKAGESSLPATLALVSED